MYCGHDYRTGTKKGTEGHLLVGAILTLLAGILGVALTVISRFDGHIDSIISSPTGVLYLACAILGVVGGYAALRRKWFPIAVLGAGAAIITPAFLFAIPGLILIASSATRFKDHSDKT
jgi:ABC-type dipeptide/oligopeptide/nickel transport system permease subunit